MGRPEKQSNGGKGRCGGNAFSFVAPVDLLVLVHHISSSSCPSTGAVSSALAGSATSLLANDTHYPYSGECSLSTKPKSSCRRKAASPQACLLLQASGLTGLRTCCPPF
jgi:hypothetical protein